MSESLPKSLASSGTDQLTLFQHYKSQKDSKLAFLWRKTVDGTPKPLQGKSNVSILEEDYIHLLDHLREEKKSNTNNCHRTTFPTFLKVIMSSISSINIKPFTIGGAQPAINKNASGIISAGRAKRSIAQPDDVRERFRQLKEQEKRSKKNKTVAKIQLNR